MTGRAAGYCAGYPVPGTMNPVGGRGGWGRGRGRGGGRGGRGWRNRFYATGLTGWQRVAMGSPGFGGGVGPAVGYAAPLGPTMTKDQEIEALTGQAEDLEAALAGLRMRIAELEGDGDGR